MRLHVLVPILAAGLIFAEDAVPIPPAAPTPPPSNWEWKTKLGIFFQNTAAHNAETSRDTTISGTNDSLAYKLQGEGTLVWKEDKDRLEQKLEANYGQIKTKDQDEWQENADSIRYGITYERTLTKPQFTYTNGTAESVFTGKDPDNEPFDPVTTKLSVGYGHRYEDLLPEKDSLVWRVGVYVRKRWERDVPDYQTEVETGPEWYVRYERTQTEDIRYFAQYDGYSEFSDMGHVTNLGQAGLSVRVAKLLTVELKGRAYYETRPVEAARTDEGYNQWSFREEALVGLVWETGSL